MNKLNKLKLTQKFALVVFGFAFVPVVLLAVVLYGNMQNVVIESKIKDVHQNLVQLKANVDKGVELCNMTTQVFLYSSNLREFLARSKSGATFAPEELVDFYRGEVGNLEKMVNSNPYLYQVRVYHPNKNVPEFMPLVYHDDRMKRLAWAQEGWVSGDWQLEYEDAIFPAIVKKPTQHIMSLVTAMEDYTWGPVGVLEVAIRMDELFPDLYATQGDTIGALFTNKDEVWYYGGDRAEFWEANRQAILARMDESALAAQTLEMMLDGKRALVSAIPLDQIGGRYFSVTFLAEATEKMAGRRNQFFIGTALSLLLLALVIDLLAKAMLKRFYLIMGVIVQVQKGNLSIAVPDVGDDEIGILGKQINLMLEKIVQLMDENINRQLLAKNSEIRALQSQINAHFIYNVLESIKMTAEVEQQYEIADAITALGKLLRYSMRWTPDNVTIREEVDNIENYISLINLRFDYSVNLRQHLPPHIMAQKIPKLILQPIIENAVVHGIEELAEDAFIDIRAEAHGPCFTLEITDYGNGMAPAQLEALKKRIAGKIEYGSGFQNGIGLKNVHDRIVMAFGADYGLDFVSEAGSFTRIIIRIPYSEQESSL